MPDYMNVYIWLHQSHCLTVVLLKDRLDPCRIKTQDLNSEEMLLIIFVRHTHESPTLQSNT